MLKKLSLLFFIILLPLTALGFGCKGLSGVEKAAIAPVSLEYWTVFDDVDALTAVLDKFKTEHSYITVNVRQFRAEEIYPRLVEALAEDKGPDIISIRNRWVDGYLTKLAPMPETLSDTTLQIIKGRFSTQTVVTTKNRPAITADQVENEYVKTVAQDVARDKKVYGLPLSLDTMALYYNKDLLDRAGIPEPPKTWEEFQTDVKKLTKFDKKLNKITQSGAAMGVGSNVPGSDDLFYILMKQSGVNVFDKSGRAVFNTYTGAEESPTVTVMNFYTDFANPARDTYTWNDTFSNALDSFVNGSVAFFFGYSYHYQVIKARAPQLNFKVMPMLQLNPEQPVNVANYWVDAVLNKSKKQTEAWNLVDYLAHSAMTKDYLDAAVRPSALRNLIAGQQDNAELKPFVVNALVADNWYKGKNYEAASRAINDMLKEWLEPATNPNRPDLWQNEVLGRAASKINQTL